MNTVNELNKEKSAKFLLWIELRTKIITGKIIINNLPKGHWKFLITINWKLTLPIPILSLIFFNFLIFEYQLKFKSISLFKFFSSMSIKLDYQIAISPY